VRFHPPILLAARLAQIQRVVLARTTISHAQPAAISVMSKANGV
jgi:hypothetical protein